MKLAKIVCLSVFALSTTAFAAGGHGHETTPRFGGVVSIVMDLNYELVVNKEFVRLHVSDHGKPLDFAGVSAKLVLLSGTEKREVELKPEGDFLQAGGSFAIAPGTKALAQVKFKNASVQSVRFVLK